MKIEKPGTAFDAMEVDDLSLDDTINKITEMRLA